MSSDINENYVSTAENEELLLKQMRKIMEMSMSNSQDYKIALEEIKEAIEFSVENSLCKGDVFSAITKALGEIFSLILSHDFAKTYIELICLIANDLSSISATITGDSYQDKVLKAVFDPLIGITISGKFDLNLVKLAMKTLNFVIPRTSSKIRDEFSSSRSGAISKLNKLLKVCGDYDLQVSIIEVFFRLCQRCSDKKTRVKSWINDLRVLNKFIQINGSSFDVDTRNLLFLINEESDPKSVKSIPCLKMEASGIELKKPSDENYTEFWVDFNPGSKSILVNCTIDESASNLAWDAVTLKYENISSISFEKKNGTTILFIEMKIPASEVFEVSTNTSIFTDGTFKMTFDIKYNIELIVKDVFGESLMTSINEPIRYDRNIKSNSQSIVCSEPKQVLKETTVQEPEIIQTKSQEKNEKSPYKNIESISNVTEKTKPKSSKKRSHEVETKKSSKKVKTSTPEDKPVEIKSNKKESTSKIKKSSKNMAKKKLFFESGVLLKSQEKQEVLTPTYREVYGKTLESTRITSMGKTDLSTDLSPIPKTSGPIKSRLRSHKKTSYVEKSDDEEDIEEISLEKSINETEKECLRDKNCSYELDKSSIENYLYPDISPIEEPKKNTKKSRKNLCYLKNIEKEVQPSEKSSKEKKSISDKGNVFDFDNYLSKPKPSIHKKVNTYSKNNKTTNNRVSTISKKHIDDKPLVLQHKKDEDHTTIEPEFDDILTELNNDKTSFKKKDPILNEFSTQTNEISQLTQKMDSIIISQRIRLEVVDELRVLHNTFSSTINSIINKLKI